MDLWCCHHDLVIARVHPVHMMDAEQHQVAADPWTNMTDLSHQCAAACRQLRHYIYYNSARKLIIVLPSH